MSFAVQRLGKGRQAFSFRGLLLVGTGVIAVAMVGLQLAGERVDAVDAGLIYMLLTILVSARFGIAWGLAVATGASVVINYAFLDPLFGFTMSKPAHIVAVPVFYIGAGIGVSLRQSPLAIEAPARAFAPTPIPAAAVPVAVAVPTTAPAAAAPTAAAATPYLHIDTNQGVVHLNGSPLRLTPTEYKLLSFLASNSDRVLRPQAILAGVWGPGYTEDARVLRTYINQLRSKLGDDAQNPRFIRTDPGFGYTFLGQQE